MSKPSVLIVLSSHEEFGTTGKKTGWYLPEFAHPYEVLSPVANITIASPAGGKAPLDPSSVEGFKSDEVAQNFLKTQSTLWENTQPLASFLGKADQFDAIFYVGGHGPLFDLAVLPDSYQLINEFYEAGKIVSAVCHGPAVLVNVKTKDGKWLVDGCPVTAFTNAEEEQIGLLDAVPLKAETELKNRGAIFESAPEPWGVHVSRAKNGKLLTGQNPASARPLALALKKELGL